MVIVSSNLKLFAEGVQYATAYRPRQMPNGHSARETQHLSAAPMGEEQGRRVRRYCRGVRCTPGAL